MCHFAVKTAGNLGTIHAKLQTDQFQTAIRYPLKTNHRTLAIITVRGETGLNRIQLGVKQA